MKNIVVSIDESAAFVAVFISSSEVVVVVVDVVVVDVVLLVVVPHCRVQIVNDFELNINKILRMLPIVDKAHTCYFSIKPFKFLFSNLPKCCISIGTVFKIRACFARDSLEAP